MPFIKIKIIIYISFIQFIFENRLLNAWNTVLIASSTYQDYKETMTIPAKNLFLALNG